MNALIKLFTTDKETKKGYPIKMVLSDLGKEKSKVIGHSSLKDWNIRTQLPLETHISFDELYPLILKYRSRAVKNDFKQIENFDEAFGFIQEIKINKRLDFYKLAQEEIDYMYSLGRDGNAKSYNTAIVQLKQFAPTLFLDQLDTSFIENFKRYKKLTVKNSTIRAYLAALRAMYNNIIVRKKLPDNRPFERRFRDIPVPKRRVKNVYLDKAGIKLLEAAYFEQVSYQRAIDLSLLQFYFGGADLMDIYYLKNSQLNNGRIYWKRSKRRMLEYEFDLKVFEKSQKLLDKYRVPGEYLFPWRKDRTGYDNFYHRHMDNLEKVCELLDLKTLPKNEKLTTKAIRHTFKTIGKFLFIDADIIRELMGHERNDIDTAYADLYPEKVRDDAHWKIIDTE